MSMIGKADQLLNDVREAALMPGDALQRGMVLGFKMQMADGRFQHVPKENILGLLEMTTDKTRDWYDEHRLSGPELIELIAEVASILPFDGVLSQKGNLAAALVSTYTKSLRPPEPSSGNSGDGGQKTSPDAESGGSYIKPTSAPNEESATN